MPLTDMSVSRAPASARSSAAQRSRAQTRQRLLDAGRRLFAERGLHGVTSHDIAAAAGVAAGTFYLHFRDKGALFREIAEQTIALLRARLDAATRSAGGPREAVPAFSEALIDFAEENRDLVRILFSRDAEAAEVEADLLQQLAETIAGGRRARIASGEMPPELHPEVLAQALVGLLARVVAWWLENPQRASRRSVVETLTRIQLQGTHPPEAT
jgi:AcrR family transcriptional regulator